MLHYHGTPCGGPRQDVARFLSGRHALIPFPRPEDVGAAAEVCQSFVIDNGAFTIWKQGGTLDVKAYAAFVEQWFRHPAFDWCLIPDSIEGDWRENWDMVNRWQTTSPSHWFSKRSVPVWHFHDPVEYLVQLSNLFDRVALGSSGRWPTPGTEDWWDRVEEFMPAICDEGKPRCKLHGLRMLNPDLCRHLPLSSADSTNAVQNSSNFSRYGSYLPPTASQRMAVIADRMEACQSAPLWIARPEPVPLFSMS